MIERRRKDIRIVLVIPLPRKFWRKIRASDQARANMSAAQKRRWEKRETS